MDATLIAVALHSLERIVAVLLGGLAVYYGFRLFLVLPTVTQSDGEIKLPGMSVVLAKAGPGLFFVAFGALVILASLFRPIQVAGSGIEYAGIAGKPSPGASAGSQPAGAARPGAEQEAARLHIALQTINCMQRLASARAKTLGTDLDHAAREAKLALLARAWDAGAWGDFGAFEQWATGRAASISSVAKVMFEAERSDCSR